VGGASTIKNWYPPKEQATASGFFMGSASLSLVVTPMIAVWIMVHHGWRSVFVWFAIPGILISILWYLAVHSRPEESPYTNELERAYIREASAQSQAAAAGADGSLGWVDKIIRRREVRRLETNGAVFKSWNVWGIALTYFFVNFVSYGMMTWIPTFLVKAKGYSFVRMGIVAATPWLGAMLGQMSGGWFSDKLLFKRRKPMLMAAPLATVVMLVVLINAPNSVVGLSVILFLTGFLCHSAWGSFFAYPMGLTSRNTYPTAVSIMTSVGNFSGFFSPMIAGYLLDVYKTFDVVFLFMAACAFLALITALTLEEPIPSKQAA
jgi:sugar phosphate permease